MKANISTKEIEKGKGVVKLLSKADPPLHPHHLKKVINDYQNFNPHHQHSELWVSSKINKQKLNQKYDKIALLVSGIASSGKDAIRDEINRLSPNFIFKTVTATSRQPRKGETEGLDYYFFKDIAAFEKSIGKGEFIEFVYQGNRLYGLPKKSLNDALKQPSPIIWSQVEISAWPKLEKHLNSIPNQKILTLKLFVIPHMRFSEYQKWLNLSRNDDNVSRLIRTGWELQNAPKKTDLIVLNKFSDDGKALTNTSQTLVNLIKPLLSLPEKS